MLRRILHVVLIVMLSVAARAQGFSPTVGDSKKLPFPGPPIERAFPGPIDAISGLWKRKNSDCFDVLLAHDIRDNSRRWFFDIDAVQFGYERSHYREPCRVICTYSADSWWRYSEHHDSESDQWFVTSIEKYEFIENADPIVPVSSGRELRLRTITARLAQHKTFRLAGDVLQYEFGAESRPRMKVAVRLSEQEVALFWHFVEALGYKAWSREYDDPAVMDGSGFRFRVVDGDENFDVRGFNKAPQRAGSEEPESSLGLIRELRTELLRLITEADEIYIVPGWTEHETLDW